MGVRHWITQGSHCEDDYPDKECPASRGKRVLDEPLLYNLAYSVGETRNLSVAAYPHVVASQSQILTHTPLLGSCALCFVWG